MAFSSNPVIQGSDLMLFIGTGDNKKSIGFATNHTIEISVEMLENASKDHSSGSWSGSIPKKKSWTASSENLFANDAEGVTFAELISYMKNDTALTAEFTIDAGGAQTADAYGIVAPTGGWNPSTASGTSALKGTVYINSISANAQNGEIATFTVNFTGTGELNVVTYPVTTPNP